MRRSGRLTLAGFGAAGVVAMALATAAYWVTQQQREAAAGVARTHEALASLARARTALIDMQSGQRGFVIAGREEFLVPYHRGLAALAAELPRTRALLAAAAAQRERLDRLEQDLGPRLELARRIIETRRAEGLEAAVRIAQAGELEQRMEGLLARFAELEAGERRLLERRSEALEAMLRGFWGAMAALVLSLAGALAVLYRLVRRRAAEQLEAKRELESRVALRTRELHAANGELLEAKRRLQTLSARLISVHEAERKHVSRELHDEMGQVLAGLRMRLDRALRGDPGHEKCIAECAAILDEAIVRARHMAVSLRPPMLDDLGLAEALEWALGQQARSAGWQVRFDVDGDAAGVAPEVRTACFRIAQEALANVARHARARNVALELRADEGGLELTLSDDGVGFEKGAAGGDGYPGLVSMSERASLAGGRFEVDSAPGAGTRIRLAFEANPVHA